MNIIQNTTRWLGLALACGTLTFAVTTQAGKPVKPPPPPSPPPLTYTLFAFEQDPTWLGNSAAGITEGGLVPGRFDYQMEFDGSLLQLSWPTAGARIDANGNGLLDLPDPLLLLAGHQTGEAWRANELGRIAGWSESLVSQAEWPPTWVFAEGVVWLPDQNGYETPIGLGVIDARLHQSYAMHVNNQGVVAGGCTWGNTVNWHRAFIVVPRGTTDAPVYFQDLNHDGVNDLMLPIWPGPDPNLITWPFDPNNPLTFPPQDPVAYINGLNDSGALCGTIESPVAITPDPRGAFVIIPDFTDSDGDGNPWFKADGAGNNTLIQKLPVLKQGAYTVARAINSAGEIAGVSNDHAVLWKPVSSGGYAIQDLGTVAACEHVQIVAMSNTGWIVGYGYTSPSSHGGVPKPLKPEVPVVWRNGVVYPVSDLLTNGTGWTDLRFADVSDTGILAGYGMFNGKRTACLAVPNSP